MDNFETTIKKKHYFTELAVSGSGFAFECRVSNGLSTRNRRQLLLTIYNAISPHLDFISRSTIHHEHHDPVDIYGRDEFAMLSTRQGIHITDDQTKLGYFIRGIRTKLGKTQKEFSVELGISSNYLSLIEKGNRTPSSKIVRKIQNLKPDPWSA
jgi:DNA-binding XRE family transcriptional regulator